WHAKTLDIVRINNYVKKNRFAKTIVLKLDIFTFYICYVAMANLIAKHGVQNFYRVFSLGDRITKHLTSNIVSNYMLWLFYIRIIETCTNDRLIWFFALIKIATNTITFGNHIYVMYVYKRTGY